MKSANDSLFDASVRHQIAVRRHAAEVAVVVLAFLEEADRAIARLLREALPGTTLRSKGLKDLLEQVRVVRLDAVHAAQDGAVGALRDLTPVEVDAEIAMLTAAIPFEAALARPVMKEVWAAISSRPVAGQFLRDWFKIIGDSDRRRIQAGIQTGLAQGEGIDDMVRRIAGSKANQWRDGALAITRRQVEAVVRTAVNLVSNEARDAVWEANKDIIIGLRWTSVLDGRTSPWCRSADGKIAPIGDKPLPDSVDERDRLQPPEARPPYHFNCRSTMVAILDGENLLGTRPFVTDTRRPSAREVDFRAEARATGRPIQDIRAEWAAENVGQAPAATTYETWLGNQSVAFQDDVLGPARGRLFRSGSLALFSFVDASGRTLTLEELQRITP